MRNARSYRDFLRQLVARRLAASYLFLGSEGFWVDEALTALRDALLTDDFTNLGNLSREGDTLLVDKIMMQVLGQSVGPRRGDGTETIADCRSQTAKCKTGEGLMLVGNETQEARFNDARRAIESFDYTAYQGRETDIDSILMQVRTPPFLARKRLVVVRDFDKYRKGGQERLLEELKKESETCRFVLTASGDYWRLEPLIAGHGCSKLVVEIASAGADEIDRFIDRWSEQTRIKVTADARQLLVELSDSALATIRSELEKIRTFLGSGNAVTRETIRDLTGHWREYQVSEFVDAVARRERRVALNTLWRLDEWNEEPVKITGWLAMRFMRMMAHSYGDARFWSKPELVGALRHLALIDMKLKRGYPEKYYLLESFVIRRAAPARKAS